MPAEQDPSLVDQIHALYGSTGVDRGTGTRESESFEAQYKKLKHDHPDAVKGEVEVAAKEILKGSKKFEREMKLKNKIPSHSEIENTHGESTLNDKLEIDYALIRRAFEANRGAEAVEGSKFPVLKLAHLQERSSEALGIQREFADPEWDRIRAARGKPYIFYTPVREPVRRMRDLWKDKGITKETGEVLVTMSMNNGATLETNTVVTMLVRHKGGRLLWGDNQAGLIRTQSEADYHKAITKPEDDCTANDLMVRGIVTIDKCKAMFDKQSGKSLEKYWVEHDRKLTETPSKSDIHADEELERRQVVAEGRQELLKRLNGEYVTKLHEQQQLEAKILRQARANIAVIEARNAEIIQNELFGLLKDLLTDEVANAAAIERIKRSIVRQHGVAMEYLEKLLERG